MTDANSSLDFSQTGAPTTQSAMAQGVSTQGVSTQGVSAQTVAQTASPRAAAASGDDANDGGDDGESSGIDLRWVWLEVRKRVFIKLPFSRPVADAMEAVVPIVLEDNEFICGLPTHKFPLSGNLAADNVRNTIEAILRQAARRDIHFEVIEGTTLAEWRELKSRRNRAQEAVIAMAEQHIGVLQYEDVLNQVVGEIRGRVTGTRDRIYPQVRAALVLNVVPLLSDTADMLFDEDRETHDARRVMARTIDRVAAFLEIQPLMLAMEIERYHRAQVQRSKHPTAGGTPTDAAD